MQQLSLAIIAVVIFCCCGKADSFTVEATFESMPTQNVEIYTFNHNAVSYQSVAAIDGKLSFKGNAPSLAMVEMYSRTGNFLGRIPVENGDKIEVKFSQSGEFTIKGNDEGKQYSDMFGIANAPKGEDADGVVASFIESNPADALSPLLLEFITDKSSNPAEALRLATLIRDNEKVAEPVKERMTELITEFAASGAVEVRKLEPVMLMVPNDTVGTLDFTSSPLTLVYFSARDRMQDSLANHIKLPKGVNMAVLRTTFDTIMWSKSRNTYKLTSPTFYWTPAGPATPGLDRFNVPSLPWVSLVDSLADEIYRGTSLESAVALADSIMQSHDSKK